MKSEPEFDAAAAHRYFSADYFNRVWRLLDKTGRSSEEDEQMISMAHASLAHWRDRDGCGPQQLSIGLWQLSRVYAELGRAILAEDYGQRCLQISKEEPPFYRGYAHEALARAARASGDSDSFRKHLEEATALAGEVADEQERKMLTADLDGLKTD